MKLTKHAWMLWAIVLIVTLVFAFVIPFVHTEVYWLALGCTAAMFGVCAFAFARAFRRDSTMESKLLGWPIFKVGYVALIAQIIVGFALMGVSALCPVWAAVIAEVVVFAVTAFCFVAKDAAREAVTQMEAVIPDATAPWKVIRAKVSAIAAETGHPEIKKLADDIRYASPMPTALDERVSQLLEALAQDPSDANIQAVQTLLAQRRTLARDSKS